MGFCMLVTVENKTKIWSHPHKIVKLMRKNDCKITMIEIKELWQLSEDAKNLDKPIYCNICLR